MEIPNLVLERLGDESIEATVALGDEDIVAVTPTQTILYRGEGLLSDESIETYPHDIERLSLSTGRRNVKFSLTYVDGTREFKVPRDRGDTLLQILMQEILRVAGVADDDESVAGVFQFSELTLVITESRLVKHIGAPVWDEDFEVFDYADVTDLDFEEGSVATQLVITVDGRPQRIKAPSDQAPQVKQTLTQTLCAYYDVPSLEALIAKLSEDEPEDTDESSVDDTAARNLELDDGISPLVDRPDDSDDIADRDDGSVTAANGPEASDFDTTKQSTPAEPTPAETSQTAAADGPHVTDEQRGPDDSVPSEVGQETRTRQTTGPLAAADERIDPEDIEAIKTQLTTLTEAVKRQNKLLREHSERLDASDEKVDQLIEELRRGR